MLKLDKSYDKELDVMLSSKKKEEGKRALVVKMLKLGHSTGEIKELVNVSDTYISKYKKVYITKGALALKLGYKGSVCRLSKANKASLFSYLSTLDTVKIPDLRAYIKENYGVTYKSNESYYSLLKEAGFSYQKSKNRNANRNEAAVLAKREELKKNWSRKGRR